MEQGRVYWYRRFRGATLACVAIAVAWTVAVVLPFDPFDHLLPVMIGGGAGTWLVLGYVTFLSVGVGGFAGLSSILATVELQESKSLPDLPMMLGLVTLFVGVVATCLLLGIAGAVGGYAQTVSHVSSSTLRDMLTPYVDVTRATAGVAVLGALATVFGIAAARGETRSE